MTMTAPQDRILVIKLGALGDVVQALGPFAAIRAHHPQANLVLLTTRPYEELARSTALFDEIWLDSRPGKLNLPGWFDLRRRLRGGHFDRVYDLQTSDRSSFYFRLLAPGPRPQWSGIARGCSHPHTNPARDAMHTIERQAEQLLQAGIDVVAKPEEALNGKAFEPADAAFLTSLGVVPPFALLVPGGAVHRPEKRWPADRFAALAKQILADGMQPVLLGGEAEMNTLTMIGKDCPGAVNLSGRTGLLDLVRLARAASVAVGNDTGPMHLIATAGCPSLVLFSASSDPALCGQRGARVKILRQDRLDEIKVADVVSASKTLADMGMPA